MSAIIAMIVAALPRALLYIASKLFTDDLFQIVLSRVLIAALKYAASLSKNTVDDEIVALVEKKLSTPPDQAS